LICYIVCGNMRAKMMNGDKRNVKRHSKSLCEIHTYKQCPYKSGCKGHRNGIKVTKGNTCLIDRFLHHRGNVFTMSS